MLVTRLNEESERYCNMVDFMVEIKQKIREYDQYDLANVVVRKIIHILYWLIDVMKLVEDHKCNDVDFVFSVINDYRSDIINDLNELLTHDCFLNSPVKTKIKDYIPAFEKESTDFDKKFAVPMFNQHRSSSPSPSLTTTINHGWRCDYSLSRLDGVGGGNGRWLWYWCMGGVGGDGWWFVAVVVGAAGGLRWLWVGLVVEAVLCSDCGGQAWWWQR
nr:hypothetical protein [Tanacetum cinerariifolium]